MIEAKWIGEPLQKHDSQLFRYFGTSKAKFAILTNGMYYRFYTDLDETNKMDEKPFLEINILDVKEGQINELKKFHKSNFNVTEIFDTASDLKYSNEFKNLFAEQLQQPSDDFVKLFLAHAYDGRQTQSVIDRFRDILKKSLNNYINELMNDKIKSALGNTTSEQQKTSDSVPIEEPINTVIPKIATTEEELEAYFIVKNILLSLVDAKDITYKDNERYMVITYKNKVTNWICRLYFNSESNKYIAIPNENKKEIRIDITDVYDIQKYNEQLINVLKRYL